ncbi:hypothetical protein Tco_1225392 [Tanacetum coccineum]
MVSTMTTRNAGRRTAATRGGGTSEQDGREGERSGDTLRSQHGPNMVSSPYYSIETPKLLVETVSGEQDNQKSLPIKTIISHVISVTIADQKRTLDVALQTFPVLDQILKP